MDDVVNRIIRCMSSSFIQYVTLISLPIQVTVQTGAITAVCAIVDLIVYLVDNTGTYVLRCRISRQLLISNNISSHLIFNVPLSKLYTNSLMSSLNARGGWKFAQSSASATPTNYTTTIKPRVQTYMHFMVLFSSLMC